MARTQDEVDKVHDQFVDAMLTVQEQGYDASELEVIVDVLKWAGGYSDSLENYLPDD